MELPESDIWIESVALVLFFASLMTWFALLRRKRRLGYILRHEPRTPVPWGPIGAVMAGIMLLMALGSLVAGQDTPEPLNAVPNPAETIEGILAGMLAEVLFVGIGATLVALFSSAHFRDLGLPRNVGEFFRDVRIGGVAWMAALVPVFAMQMVIISLVVDEEKVRRNPLIEMVFRNPNYGVMALASIMAVVVAPVCEEIVFRLLLQGWLEKWEDRKLGWRRPAAGEAPTNVDTETAGIPGDTDSGNAYSMVESTSVADTSMTVSELPPCEPPRMGLAGLPYGWLPVVISSFIFAAAHMGSGPDPVPLYFLALILGYIYQRTHRILPSIVTHALFNLTSMLALWRLVSLGGQ